MSLAYGVAVATHQCDVVPATGCFEQVVGSAVFEPRGLRIPNVAHPFALSTLCDPALARGDGRLLACPDGISACKEYEAGLDLPEERAEGTLDPLVVGVVPVALSAFEIPTTLRRQRQRESTGGFSVVPSTQGWSPGSRQRDP